MVWSYATMLGIDCELANNGDDCVVIMEQGDEAKFREALSGWFRKRGFAMTVEETVDEFERIEFCQTHPVQLSTGWRMVRNLSAILQKDPMCLLPIPNETVYRKWLDAVGTCGTKLCSGVPLHFEFYSVFKRYGVDCGNLIEEVYRGRSQLSLAKGCQEAMVTDRSRVSYYYAFGVLPDEQCALETYYQSLQLSADLSPPVYRDGLLINPRNNTIYHL
jgi:acylphosphatase